MKLEQYAMLKVKYMNKFKEQIKLIEEALLKPASNEDILNRKKQVAQLWKQHFPSEIFNKIETGDVLTYDELKKEVSGTPEYKNSYSSMLSLLDCIIYKINNHFYTPSEFSYILISYFKNKIDTLAEADFEFWTERDSRSIGNIRYNSNIDGIMEVTPYFSRSWASNENNHYINILIVDREPFLNQFN